MGIVTGRFGGIRRFTEMLFDVTLIALRIAVKLGVGAGT
jgi:hypothetical protein